MHVSYIQQTFHEHSTNMTMNLDNCCLLHWFKKACGCLDYKKQVARLVGVNLFFSKLKVESTTISLQRNVKNLQIIQSFGWTPFQGMLLLAVDRQNLGPVDGLFIP